MNFIQVIFAPGNETHEKNWSDFGAEQNEEWSEKRMIFVHTAVFERARNSDVKRVVIE